MIETALFQQLTADQTVASLIGTRLYPVIWPDDPIFGLATYQRISTVTENLLSGPLSIATVRIQYDAWAETYLGAKQIAAALNTVLEGFQGILPDGTHIDNITLDSSFDLFDSPSVRYRVSSDYLVTYTRQ